MRKVFAAIFVLFSMMTLFSGCALWPFGKKAKVHKNPAGKTYLNTAGFELQEGFPEMKTWWVAFSDNGHNSTTLSPENDMPQKKLPFLEPVFIVNTQGEYVQVAQYSADIDLAVSKGKVDKKKIKYLGWIKKTKLLLWTSAVKEKQTGFFAKAITAVNAPAMVTNAGKYFSSDSLLLFTDPLLSDKAAAKIAIGEIVFIYKQSEDKRSYLLGTTERSTTDNIRQNIIGWISADAVTIWGTRQAIKMQPQSGNNKGLYATAALATALDTLPLLNADSLGERSAFENIFPVQNNLLSKDPVLKTLFKENIIDYTNNKVYNVLGRPVYYSKYKSILSDHKKINVIFVIDAGSNNSIYFPSITTATQDLQYYFDTTRLFSNYHFGAVLYRHRKCENDTMPDVLPLTSNYTDVVKFINNKQKASLCEDVAMYQPVYKGITDACNLLMPVKNETNVVIIIGTTGTEEINNGISLNEVIGKVSKVQARLLFFQTVSKANNSYNDFVLAAEKTVINSSENIAELKKERLVDNNDIINNPSYNLVTGDSGVYFLDYPARSMSQGFVLFPKKGEAMQPAFFKRNFDTLLRQITQDDGRIAGKLKQYFKTIGIKETVFKKGYPVPFDTLTQPLPVDFLNPVAEAQTPFLVLGYTQAKPFSDEQQLADFGIFLTEDEYDKLIKQFESIYKATGATAKFKQRKAYRGYHEFLSEMIKQSGIKAPKGINKMSIAEALYIQTGFVSADSLLNSITVGQLKNSNKLNRKEFIQLYNRFEYAATKLVENKNSSAVKIPVGNKIFYWINKNYLP